MHHLIFSHSRAMFRAVLTYVFRALFLLNSWIIFSNVLLQTRTTNFLPLWLIRRSFVNKSFSACDLVLVVNSIAGELQVPNVISYLHVMTKLWFWRNENWSHKNSSTRPFQLDIHSLQNWLYVFSRDWKLFKL